MTTAGCRSFTVVAVALVVAASRPATAQAPAPVAEPEPIQLELVAPDGCPSADAFFAQLQARAPAARVTRSGVRRFRVEIVADEAGARFHGRLEVVDPDGGASVREVDGATCAETVTALALVGALALEEVRVAPVAAVAPVRAPVAPVRAPVTAPASPRRGWHLAAGAGAEVDGGVAPGALTAGTVFASLRRDRRWAIRLGVARSTLDDTTSAAGIGSFRWTVGEVEACPLALALGRWSASPCAGLQAGALTARGADVGMAATSTRPWLAPELALRLRVGLGRVGLEVAGIGAAPLVRDRFFIAPSTTVHRAAPVTAAVQLAVTIDL